MRFQATRRALSRRLAGQAALAGALWLAACTADRPVRLAGVVQADPIALTAPAASIVTEVRALPGDVLTSMSRWRRWKARS